MSDDEEITICPELGVDSDLVPLLGKESITLQALECFHDWRRGSDEESIAAFYKITIAEAKAHIEKVMKLLPERTLAANIELRNEIIAIRSRSQERERLFQESLTKSVQSYLDSGQDPTKALREFREFINTNTPEISPDIREPDGISGIDEKADEIRLEDETRLVRALRSADQKPVKAIPAKSTVEIEPNVASYHKNEQNKGNPNQNAQRKRTDRRITFRLDPVLHEKLQLYRQDAGIDLSMVVRKALAQFLEGDTLSKAAKSNEMPQEALSLTGRFRVWGSDLREELWIQFLRTLAAAYVSTRRWHRDEKSRRLFEELIRLYRSLEADGVRQI